VQQARLRNASAASRMHSADPADTASASLGAQRRESGRASDADGELCRQAMMRWWWAVSRRARLAARAMWGIGLACPDRATARSIMEHSHAELHQSARPMHTELSKPALVSLTYSARETGRTPPPSP
jgi:hypothetical protein